MTIPLSSLEWTPCWRVIPSRFPPIDLFERVADPNDLEAVYALESLTNDRLRHQAGDLHLVAPEDRVSGPGSSVIMAAFTHLNPQGSRFADGSFGALYAAYTLSTCIAETRYHRERFLRATQEAPMEIDMRAYAMDLRGALHDIRGMNDNEPALYHPDDYSASQRFGKTLKETQAWGIVYDSVRHKGGECAAVFRPRILSNCRQERHLCYVWNGEHITIVYQKQLYGG